MNQEFLPEEKTSQQPSTPEAQTRLPAPHEYYRPKEAGRLRRLAAEWQGSYTPLGLAIAVALGVLLWISLLSVSPIPLIVGLAGAIVFAFLRELLLVRARRARREAERLQNEHQTRYSRRADSGGGETGAGSYTIPPATTSSAADGLVSVGSTTPPDHSTTD